MNSWKLTGNNRCCLYSIRILGSWNNNHRRKWGILFEPDCWWVRWRTWKLMRMIVFMPIHIIYRPYINLLAWTYVGIYVYTLLQMQWCIIFRIFESLWVFAIWSTPFQHPHSAHKNTQMECIWVSHETKRIHDPFSQL